MTEFIKNPFTPSEALSHLGLRFKNYRLALNLTQDQLAAKIGLTRNVIIRFESGQNITTESFLKLLSGLDLQEGLMHLIPDSSIRPVERVKNKGNERLRARPKKVKKRSTWTWGDEK